MPSQRDDDLAIDPLTGAETMGVVTTPGPTPASAGFAPGSIVAGRYRLVALLGRGGMGEVYRADDLTLDQPPYAVTVYVYSVVIRVPLSLDMSHWSATPSNWTIAVLLVLTLFGFYASRAGQPLFGELPVAQKGL